MEAVNFASVPPADPEEIVDRLSELHDADGAAAILKDAEFLADVFAAALFEKTKGDHTTFTADIMVMMMMGALRSGLLFLDVSEEGASLACRAAIDTFNAKLATMQAGAAGAVRH